MEIVSPDHIIGKLNELIQSGEKGVNALYDAEMKVADRDLVYEKAYQSAFLEAQGTVADRTAVARLKTAELKFEQHWQLFLSFHRMLFPILLLKH